MSDIEDGKFSRIWLISASGGEALPLYSEKLDVACVCVGAGQLGHLFFSHSRR